MKLSELKTGESGVIVRVMGHGGFRKRIVEMGFIKGQNVEVILNAPLHDPVKYKLMNYEVSLRKAEAELIEVVNEEEAKAWAAQNEPLTGIVATGCDDIMRHVAQIKGHEITAVFVGNPNCGKTSLFNMACGARIGTPNKVPSCSMSRWFPLSLSSSYMFSAMIIGTSMSISWVVR